MAVAKFAAMDFKAALRADPPACCGKVAPDERSCFIESVPIGPRQVSAGDRSLAKDKKASWPSQLLVAIPATAAALVLTSTLLPTPDPAHAFLDSPGRRVATFPASGFVFKDTVEVTAFPDPKIEGITIHISNMDYSTVDKFKKGLLTDPAQSSVSCTQTGPLKLLQPIAMGPEGEDVFSENRSFLFKTVHVRRIYDKEGNALVYVAYSTRLTNSEETGSRYKTSVASIGLYNQGIDLSAPPAQ